MPEDCQDNTDQNPPQGAAPEGAIPSRADEGGDEAIARAQDQLGRLQGELAEWRDKYFRVMADFQNYQRRSLQNEASVRQYAVAGLVERFIPVLDHFDVALSHDPGKASGEQVMQGVRVIREEFIKTLQRAGVRLIEPRPNDEFRPGQHEAIMQQPGEGVQSGRVAMCYQPGYAIGEQVIRAAKVGVAP